jgi:hypothetical protein
LHDAGAQRVGETLTEGGIAGDRYRPVDDGHRAGIVGGKMTGVNGAEPGELSYGEMMCLILKLPPRGGSLTLDEVITALDAIKPIEAALTSVVRWRRSSKPIGRTAYRKN